MKARCAFGPPRLALLSLLPLACFGCIAENDRVALGSGEELPLLTEQPTGRPKGDDQASLTGLDRSNWSETAFLIAPDGVASRDTYADNSIAMSATSRQRGDPPTPRSALELAETSAGARYREAFLTPVNALGEMFMIPYRMYQRAPWKAQAANPASTYWRVPTPDASLDRSTAEQLRAKGGNR